MPLATDTSPDVRRAVAEELVGLSQGTLTDTVARALANLLQDENREVVKAAFVHLRGVAIPIEIEKPLLRLAQDPKLRLSVIRFALVDLKLKSPAVIDELLRAAQETRTMGFAFLGLKRGIPVESHDKVADALVTLLQSRDSYKTQRFCIELIGRYGSEEHTPALQSLADNALQRESLRTFAQHQIDVIRRRTAG